MTIDDWYKQIEEDKQNWELRSVFADWLEDQFTDITDVLAETQRWLIEHQYASYEHSDGDNVWGDGVKYPNAKDPNFCINRDVFEQMEDGDTTTKTKWFNFFSSIIKAEFALAKALMLAGKIKTIASDRLEEVLDALVERSGAPPSRRKHNGRHAETASGRS